MLDRLPAKRSVAASWLVVFGVLLGVAGEAAAPAAPSHPEADIFVVNVDGSGRRNVTRSSASDSSPALAPDGRRLAFIRAPGELWTINVDGSRPRRLAALTDAVSGWPGGLRWSPDGSSFTLTRCCLGSRDSPEVGLIDSDGSGLRWITGASNPTWAPDGKRLAFQTDFGPGWREGPQTIAVENADGSGRRAVVRASELNAYRFSAPAWSPRGSLVAFALYARFGGGGFPLFVVDVDDPSSVRMVVDLGYNPAWSPDGGRLAFTARGGIWIVRSDGSRGRLAVSSTSVGGGARNPVWSPDGKRLAFIAGGNTVERPGSLFVVNANRGRPRILAKRLAPQKPIWSPSGLKLYYVAWPATRGE